MDLRKIALIENSKHEMIAHPDFYVRRHGPLTGMPIKITEEDFISVKIDNCLVCPNVLVNYFVQLQKDGFWRPLHGKRNLDVGDLETLHIQADLLIEMVMENYCPESLKRLDV